MLLTALFAASGCNPGSTPVFPSPDFGVSTGDRFPIRAGELVLVVGADNAYLYLSIQSVGADSRCPPASECEEPGFVELDLELETAETQGAVRLRAPPAGETVGTFRGFEIRVHQVVPPGSSTRIPPTEYIFQLSVSER